MRHGRVLLAMWLVASGGFAAELFPVSGPTIQGEVISINDKEVVFKQGDKQLTKPLKELLKIDFRDPGKLPTGKTYSLVELTDGSQLYAERVLLKKRDFEFTLFSGQVLKLPSSVVANVLFDAASEENRKDWKSRVYNARGKDIVVSKRKVKDRDKDGEREYEIASNLNATIGEGDETGTALTFAVTIGDTTASATRKLDTLRGLIFKHTLGPKAAPFQCKLLDTSQNLVMVASVTPREGGLLVTTPAGAEIKVAKENIARMDYTQGRLEYLSDLTPTKLETGSNHNDDERHASWHVYKDSNVDKGPLVLAGKTYPKGLALKPYVELVYELRGEYREFEAVVGIDDRVTAFETRGKEGPVTLIVETDGRELTRLTVSSDDKERFKELKLNIKDAQRLRIIVKSMGDLDLGHLDLADAKIRKEDN